MAKSKNNEKVNLKEKIKNKRVIVIATVLLLVLVISVVAFVVFRALSNPRVISINDAVYNESDYMIYLRIAKTELFDADTTDLPKATLNMVADKTTNMTVEEYLRVKVEQSLKVAGAIETMAEKNDISLDDDELEKLEKEKKKYISSLGGQKNFKKFLKDNRTTEEAYDNMAKIDALYKKVYDILYAEEKKFDLSDDEKKELEKEYYLTYNKAKQIVFYIVDTATKQPLSNSAIEQKKLLAETVRSMITDTSKFDEYIKKYSDDAIGVEPPYEMYFTSNKVLKEVSDTVNSISENQISDVVKSTYAYHIILKQKLDDGYLGKFYDEKREEKFLKAISDTVEDSVIIMEDEFTRVKIK